MLLLRSLPAECVAAMKQPPNSGAWVWQADPDDVGMYHEMPVDDLIEHEATRRCICGPTVFDDDDIIVIAHPSLDNREGKR